jgi:hypothetical protein
MEAQEPKTATSVSEWKRKKNAVPLDVPSGNTALIESKPVASFAKKGAIPNVLMPIVEESIKTGHEPDLAELIQKINIDEELLAQFMDVVDVITVDCTVEPSVLAVPDKCVFCQRDLDGHIKLLEDQKEGLHEFKTADRDPEALYVDEVDFEDKMAIFAFVTGGVREYESFLQEQAADVSASPDSEGVRSSTE